MAKQLMPYGSSRYAGLVAKVGTKNPIVADTAELLPYGSSRFVGLVAKVGTKVEPTGETRSCKVIRLNARAR